MNISYDYYRIFYYVAKYGSFTQAASALFLNQPNLSRAVQALESALDCTLFVRSNRGVKLTPEGERLYAHIALAMQQIEAGESELSFDKSLQRGLVSIAVSETALHGVLLPVLSRYHQLYPGVRLKISNCSTPQAMEDLERGLADFSLITTPMDLTEELTSTAVASFQVYPVCGIDFKNLCEHPCTLKDLLHHPLISLNAKTKTYELYSKWFAKQNLDFRPDIEVATTDQLMPLVQQNMGIAFVPEFFVDKAQKGETYFILPLKEPLPKRQICLVTRKKETFSIAAQKLIQMISAVEL